MRSRIVTIVLLVGLAYGLLGLMPHLQSQRLPGNQQGYEPVQPIAFSHRLHAGELQISCVYCHQGADKGKHAGIPATSLCMNCHKSVSAPLAVGRAEEAKAKEENRPAKRVVSPELHKLYQALALDDELRPIAGQSPKGIAWLQVHNLPAFACFDHRAHIGAGVSCQHCHGPVETMERVRQVESLSMGWCVNCHREATDKGVSGKSVRPSVDCAACHY
ncbi:MAG TPA: cytochrome c3 family protein [Gemmataceae bacterium]|nr:cytochrome c3 family protein [Gemmataceae bacterium]